MRLGVLILAAASLLATPAVAQPAASGAVQTQGTGSTVAARRALRIFAACVQGTRSSVATEILMQPFGSEQQRAVIERRMGSVRSCLRPGMETDFGAGALAGALAEAALQARYETTILRRVSDLSRDMITMRGLDPRSGYEELGLCVARRAPEAVRAWALSEPGSDAETTARHAVIPQVSPCVDQGQPVHADVVALRAILSTALYRALWLTR